MGVKGCLMKPRFILRWFYLQIIFSILFFNQAFALPETLHALDLRTGQKIQASLKSTGDSKKHTVLIFVSIYCPCSRSHQGVLKKLHEEFSGQQVQFFGVHSNANETVEDSLAYFKQADLPFPVIQDEGEQLANELGAYKTPHAYILDPESKVLYQGGVDNKSDAAFATEHFVRDNLILIKKGLKIGESKRRVLGCQILRSSQ